MERVVTGWPTTENTYVCMSSGKGKAVVNVSILAETTGEVSGIAVQLNLKDVPKTQAFLMYF